MSLALIVCIILFGTLLNMEDVDPIPVMFIGVPVLLFIIKLI